MMSTFTDTTVPVGLADDMHLNPLGPLESRRFRRARNSAAMTSASQTPPDSNPGTDTTDEPLEPTSVIFSDELPAPANVVLSYEDAVERRRERVGNTERVRILSES